MRHSLFFVALLLILSACNLPSGAVGTPTATILATDTPAQPSATSIPSNTPLPSDTPPPTFTFTPTVPAASPKDVAVNCRFGPGTAWVALSALNVGQSSQIVGKNSDSSWWYIVDPFSSSRNCWVSGSVINTSGNLAAIPVVQSPQAFVTNVSVGAEPGTVAVTGCLGPAPTLKLKGTIEVNGPATVKWRFETQQGGTLSAQTSDTVIFDAFGSKEVSADFTPSLPLEARTYWVRLIVTSPNSLQGETRYEIRC